MVIFFLRYVPCIPIFEKSFVMNGCWILSDAFSASIEMDHVVFDFSFVNTVDDIDWFAYVASEAGMNPTWSWCVIFLICCWIWLAKILLRIFASVFIKDIG